MKDVNELTVCRDNYRNEEEFQNAIRDAIMSLLNNRYIAVIRYDEPGLGIVAIDYQYDEQEFGAPYPYFLEPEQAEMLFLRGR